MTPPAEATTLRQRKKDATHQAISDAAWQLFEEQGYDATSVQDIAERANVAPRTFFRYFPTKEAVLYPEFDEMLARVQPAFLARPVDEPVLTSLIAAMESLTVSMTEDTHRNHARMELMKRTANDSIGEYFRRRLTEEVGNLVRLRDGDGEQAQLRARLASGIMGVIIETSRDHWLATGATEPLPDVGHRCIGLVTDLLTAPT